jgi:hypothetical protein
MPLWWLSRNLVLCLRMESFFCLLAWPCTPVEILELHFFQNGSRIPKSRKKSLHLPYLMPRGIALNSKFLSSEGTHGVEAKAAGWRVPSQGSIPGCRTNLWLGAHLPMTIAEAFLWVMPAPGRFRWAHLLKYNVRGCQTPNRVFSLNS